MAEKTAIWDRGAGEWVVRDRTADEQAEMDAFRATAATPPHTVRKLTIKRRLAAAGLWATAKAVLTRPENEDAYDDWLAAVEIASDDVTVIGFLDAIGADPDAILAPEA